MAEWAATQLEQKDPSELFGVYEFIKNTSNDLLI